MSIKQLKSKWSKEKDFYKVQENGSGVHSFIRDCLESKELFSLKEGSLSTKIDLRRNEYIYEKKAKEKRRADFVIYINPDIAIPIEAKCFGNIEAGGRQLFHYQKDFDKQYGILTDGYTWRFYNNNIYREFNLDYIFEETDVFLEFWMEYIKPDSYYLAFFEPQSQLSLFRDTEKLQVAQNRQLFFDDITRLIKSFKNKLQVEGYFNNLNLDKKEMEKRAVEMTYAYIIQFILYKTLVDNDFGKFQEEFENKVRKIHKYLKDKRYKDILGVIDGISAQISENIYRPFAKEQEFINQKLLKLYRSVENNFSDVSPWLDIFVFIKKYSFTNVESEIFGCVYENYLKELYEEEQKGQYFTDPAVVNFMLHQVGFTPQELQKRYQSDKNSISLIDPACGSGTFLYSAVNTIIKAFGNNLKKSSRQTKEIVINNIFGLDTAEFPLYLAEMSILMRMLPLIITEKFNNPVDKKIKVFLTKDSIAEFLDTSLINTTHDIEVKDGQLSMDFEALNLGYESYVREKSDLEEMKRSLEHHPQIPRRRFDYVIGNPPYIRYNDCARQKVLIFELMKQGSAQLNNIYGVNLHSIPTNKKKYPPKPDLHAFFIALGIALLKGNGKLCFIIPQTLLTAGDLDVLRYHLAKFTTIEKIVIFSGKMFIGRGIKQNKPVPTSSLIFIVSKKSPPITHQVEIINYKDPNDSIEETLQNILDDKKISKEKILQSELLNNVVNWSFIKQDKALLDFYGEYRKNSEDIAVYYDHASAELQFKSRFYFDIGFILNKKEVQNRGDIGTFYELLDFKTFYHYSRFVPTAYYPKDKSKIKLTRNNQGYATLEQRYKIVWRVKNPNRFYFTERPIIFYMGKASIICSNNKNEILYLFALLNSPLLKLVLQLNLQSRNEKEFLLPIKAIKNFVRVPKITPNNQHIKDEIIKCTQDMLALEDKMLSDFVDFSKVMTQTFDSVLVEGNNLLLDTGGKKIKTTIKENSELVKRIIKEEYGKQELIAEKQKISLHHLKTLPVIDLEKQKQIKDYIDDLVFALYFNVSLEKLGLSEAKEVKMRCYKNPYYELITTGKNFD